MIVRKKQSRLQRGPYQPAYSIMIKISILVQGEDA
jgi:hypothetical protein